MNYTIDEYQLSEMLITAAKMGAQQLAVEQGLVKTKISRAEAYRRYSKRLIDRWVNEGRIVAVKSGGRMLFDVKKLEAISSVNQLWQKTIKPATK